MMLPRKKFLSKDKMLRKCKMSGLFMHFMKLLFATEKSDDIISPSGQGLLPFHSSSLWASQGLGFPPGAAFPC